MSFHYTWTSFLCSWSWFMWSCLTITWGVVYVETFLTAERVKSHVVAPSSKHTHTQTHTHSLIRPWSCLVGQGRVRDSQMSLFITSTTHWGFVKLLPSGKVSLSLSLPHCLSAAWSPGGFFKWAHFKMQIGKCWNQYVYEKYETHAWKGYIEQAEAEEIFK